MSSKVTILLLALLTGSSLFFWLFSWFVLVVEFLRLLCGSFCLLLCYFSASFGRLLNFTDLVVE
jgi:hypothetical protein